MFRISIAVAAVMAFTASIAEGQTLKVGAAGDKAVLFNFTGLSTLNLGAYNGGVGGKYFISDDIAVRGMLLFGVDNETTKGTVDFTNATDNKLSFGIGGGLEYHLPLASRVSPYLGGEVFFMNSAETFTPSVLAGGTANSIKTTTTSFGLGAIAGVEYFFNDNVSLAAEYQFGVESDNTTNPGTDELKIGFQTAGLTFAVYF